MLENLLWISFILWLWWMDRKEIKEWNDYYEAHGINFRWSYNILKLKGGRVHENL